MGDSSSTSCSLNWIDQASSALGVQLKRRTAHEAAGFHPGCPVPGGVDRLVVWEDGNWWCRQCQQKGWWTQKPATAEEIEASKQERRLEKRRLIQQINDCQDWIGYMRHPNTLPVWHKEGMSDETIWTWGLGYCESCPTAPAFPSMTIPVFYKGVLYDIRHRLIGVDSGSKYRSHIVGLTAPFFNLDSIGKSQYLYIVEGEKKAITCSGHGCESVIAVPGKQFYTRLGPKLKTLIKPHQEIIFLPDPGTSTDLLGSVQQEIGNRLYIVELWEKPDDFIREYGQEAFTKALTYRRPF